MYHHLHLNLMKCEIFFREEDRKIHEIHIHRCHILQDQRGWKIWEQALYEYNGIDDEGKMGILSCKLCDSETEIEWESFFDDLKEKGIRDVKLVISNDHKGIQESVTRSFLGAAWQYCHVHFMRNIK